MKPLNTIVADLVYCKKLKELGVKMDTYFYWSKAMDGKKWRIENKQFFRVDKRSDIPAPTASELFEILLNWSRLREIKITPIQNNKKASSIVLSEREYRDEGFTEVNAIAKNIIHLLKNNIISLEEINSKL